MLDQEAFLQDKKNDPSWFTCPKYHTLMSRASCGNRWRNANIETWINGTFKSGFGDRGCLNCPAGKTNSDNFKTESYRTRDITAKGRRCTICNAPAYAAHIVHRFKHPTCPMHYRRLYSRWYKTGSFYRKDGTL